MLGAALAISAALGAGGDLPELRQRGTLKVLVFGSEDDALPRAGSPKSRDRELLSEFAEREGLSFELVVEDDFDALFTRLLAGEGDVLAHGLTITAERKERVAFTLPVATVKHLLVGKRGTPKLPRSRAQLKGRTVVVHGGSAYAQSLEALEVKGLTLEDAPEELDTEGVLYLVGRGELPLTVTDSNVFESVSAYNRDLVALFPVAEGKELAWALRPDATLLKAKLDAFLVEKALTAPTSRPFTGDLAAIRKRGVLRLLTWNDPVSYFAHRGELFGFDYEHARLFARRLGVRVVVVVPPSRGQLLPWLLEGRGDLIAASMHPSPELTDRVRFSRPYHRVDVMKVGEGPITLPAGTTLGFTKPAHIDPEADEADLVERVRVGELSATAVDRHLLEALPPLPASVPVTTLAVDQPLAFATRASSKKLAQALDEFTDRVAAGPTGRALRQRYFERPVASLQRPGWGKEGQLSPYDELFRTHATRNRFDWRLLAAQAFQESRFDPRARSWAGAVGLFQLMPATAAELGVTRLEDPAESTRGGSDYLAHLTGRLDPRLELHQRLLFALAAYNAGLGHVRDAQRLARERGWDPLKWPGNVERAMLLLESPAHYQRARYGYCRGSEPVKYVADISDRYNGYVKLAP